MLKGRWARRVERGLLVFLALVMLWGVARLSQVAWQSQYFGDRLPYLQRLTPTQVTIRWETAEESEGVIRYGLDSRLEHTAGGGRGWDHEVLLEGLRPDTRYYYAAGDHEPASFVTAPQPGSDVPARFWAVGDSGQIGAGLLSVRDAALRWMEAHPRGDRPLFDAGLALGDNAYRSGSNPQYQDAYFGPFANILRSFMVWPAYGNHDARRWAYFKILTLPENGEAGGVPSGTEHWYAFDHGPVHVVVLDSEASDRASDGRMLQWLREDLAANRLPWLIAVMHHPPYTDASHRSDDPGDSGGRMRDMRENALPILEASGVDLVLSGHSHSYERSHLLDCHYGTSDTLASGMVMARGGDGAVFEKASAGRGAHEGAVYVVAGSSSKLDSAEFGHPAMAASQRRLGSVVIDVAGKRLDARFIDDEGTVRDSFAIVKGAGTTHPSLCR